MSGGQLLTCEPEHSVFNLSLTSTPSTPADSTHALNLPSHNMSEAAAAAAAAASLSASATTGRPSRSLRKRQPAKLADDYDFDLGKQKLFVCRHSRYSIF